jgi:hypothetical protein
VRTFFKTAFLAHAAAVQRCLTRYNAKASLEFTDLVLQVRARNRCYDLFPQFLSIGAERNMYYSRQMDHATTGFSGWLPYFNKQWPSGTGKFAFKAFCHDAGLRTPQMWRTPGPGLRDFIVKHNTSSFGAGMQGPFATYDPREPRQAIDPQGYYEAFIRGRIIKATFWESRLAAVEVKAMTSLPGDGKSTLRALIMPKVNTAMPEMDWNVFATVAAYDGGVGLDDVPAAGRSVLVDYRYSSYVNLTVSRDKEDPQKELAGTPLLKQLEEAGAVLWRGIPEAQRPATLFTLDAILDAEDQLWLLEMNCNPVCHPRVYAHMFETLFGAPDAREAPVVPSSALPNAFPPRAPHLAASQLPGAPALATAAWRAA